MKFIDKVIQKVLGSKITYAQCGEDVILAHIFRCLQIENIKYLDIGTNHPQVTNNTYLFYRYGGQGVCVEPNPKLYKLIKIKRKRDVCLNVGVAEFPQGELDFYIINPDTLSTFSEKDAKELTMKGDFQIKEVVKIPILTINEILEKYFNVANIDLVSLDVEGFNGEIINSLDLVAFRPKVLCIETLSFSNNNQGKKIESISEKMIKHGYFTYADTFLNTIFIDQNIW